MKNIIYSVCSVSLVLMLFGCALPSGPTPNEKDFAPVMPPMPTPPKSTAGAIYNPVTAGFLFEDRRAHMIGDIITVRLVENTQAQKKANTNIKKDDATDISAPSIMGLPLTYNGNNLLSTSLSDNRDFKAQSDSQQSNSLNGQVSVMVVDLLPNGYLSIKGDKWLNINTGEEFVRISGIVRPEDVAPDNTVLSTRVANARISYSGTGQMAEANSRGWLSRFFSSDWWPF